MSEKGIEYIIPCVITTHLFSFLHLCSAHIFFVLPLFIIISISLHLCQSTYNLLKYPSNSGIPSTSIPAPIYTQYYLLHDSYPLFIIGWIVHPDTINIPYEQYSITNNVLYKLVNNIFVLLFSSCALILTCLPLFYFLDFPKPKLFTKCASSRSKCSHIFNTSPQYSCTTALL